jgi:16S rRNA processing protein RimM
MNQAKQAAALVTEPLLSIARAVKTKGLKGEIVAELLTDFPERFNHLAGLFAVSPSGEQKAVELERFSFQKGRVLLKLAGCDTVESARTLLGHEFAVPESERVKLADDEFYDWELKGCRVSTLTGRLVGTVTGVVRTGGADLLVVAGDKERFRMIPMVSSILVEVDKDRRLIVIDPPEGLLEL